MFVESSEVGLIEVEHRPAYRLVGGPLVAEAYVVPELGVALEVALHPSIGLAGVYPPEAQHDQWSCHELGRASDPAFAVVLVPRLPYPGFRFFPDHLLSDLEESLRFIDQDRANAPPVSFAQAETAH